MPVYYYVCIFSCLVWSNSYTNLSGACECLHLYVHTYLELKHHHFYAWLFFFAILSSQLFQWFLVGLGIWGPNRVSVLSNRVSVFRVYQNQPHSDYIKIRFGTGSDFIGFGSGLVNLQRTGTTRCTFGFWVPTGSSILKYLIYTYFVTKT